MRPRKWVLVFSALVLLIVSALYQSFRYLHKNRNLENTLIQSISTYFDGKLYVGSFDLVFFSAHLKNVQLLFPDNSISISIKDIKVGISFRRLLFSKGDVTKAINKIILIDPSIDVALVENKNTKLDSVLESTTVSVPADFPVEDLTVKGGTFRLVKKNGDHITLGEQLSGKLFKNNYSTEFNLSGAFASDKHNLSLNGKISRGNGISQVHFVVDNARIRKKMTIDQFTIIGGTLKTDALFTFPNSFSLPMLHISGTLQIENAQALFNDKELINDLNSRILFNGSSFIVDTSSLFCQGNRLTMNGKYDFSSGSSETSLICDSLNLKLLSEYLPDSLKPLVAQTVFCKAKIRTDNYGDNLKFSTNVKGILVYGEKLNELSISGNYTKDSLWIDSLNVESRTGKLRVQGGVGFNNVLRYSARFTAHIDSFPEMFQATGKAVIDGNVTGSNSHYLVNAFLNGSKITVGSKEIGDVSLLVQGNDEKLKFRLSDSLFSPLQLSGIVVNVLKKPMAKISLKIKEPSINGMHERKPAVFTSPFDRVNLYAEGWIDTFKASFDAKLVTPMIAGDIAGNMNREGMDAPVVWSAQSRELFFRKRAISVGAKGRFFTDSIVCDSIGCLEGISGSGRVMLNSQPQYVEANVRYAIELNSLFAYFPELSTRLDRGYLNGSTRISGALNQVQTHTEMHLRNLGYGDLGGLQTDAIISTNTDNVQVFPFVIRKNDAVIVAIDSIICSNSKFRFAADFEDVDIKTILGKLVPADINLIAGISGRIESTGSGFPIKIRAGSTRIQINKQYIDSLDVAASILTNGIKVDHVRAQDGPRVRFLGSGYFPWVVFGKDASELDTMKVSLDVKGDILKSVEKNLDSPIGGTGFGTAKIDCYTVQGNWHFTRGEIVIPTGTLTLRPFVLDDINNFSLKISIDSSASVFTDLRGLVRKRPIRIFSTHKIPEDYEPLTIGPVDFGILQIETPKRGIHIHLPGFMVPGEVGDVEFAGRDPFSQFALSGPLDRLKITGTWIFRDIDFTFPFLSNNEIPWDFDPFPYVTWEMDLKPGNRKMMYFWDLAGKKRRIFRFLEGYLDQSSYLMVRGRDLDKTFRLSGMIHSSKGNVFYGKVFDRNFDVAVEFSPLKFPDGRGYDNMPIISGSAETMSDSSRLNRIKLTCFVNDPATGAIAERGRLVEGKSLNVTFHLTSDYELLDGETEKEFFQQAGLVFTTFQKAGEAVSSFGEQYFQRYLLQRWERRLARTVGLDVINIESSIASNYFNKLYSRQFNGLVNQNDYLAFANVGITVGRYFFRDLLFLKARGELIPIDTTLTPEYSIGLEFQANRYFTIDLNYGIHKGELEIEHNPQVVMQLRLPLTRLRKFLNF